MEHNSKFTESFSGGCFMRHRLPWFFDIAFDLHIFSIVHLVVDHFAKLVFFVAVAEADDSATPTLRSFLLSPLPPPPLAMGSRLPSSCITDDC